MSTIFSFESQVMARIFNPDQFRRGRNQFAGGFNLFNRPERILRAMHKQRRDRNLGEMLGARLVGPAGRVQRIGEQEQTICQCLVGKKHAGLTSAVTLTAEKDASGLATGTEFWARVDALGDRPYHRPIDMKGL